MKPIRFGVVGAGWRAAFFFRIVAAMPEQFALAGAVTRDQAKGARLEAEYGAAELKTFRSVEALLDASDVAPEFLVSSVSSAANYEVNRSLVGLGLPILSETPPAGTVEQLRALWDEVQTAGARVQVIEQFHRQPLHAARIEAIRQGRIGPAHTAYLSVCHGYHGTSLLRRFLDVGFDEARITGAGWQDRVLDPGGRDGPPAQPEVKALAQQMALLDFGAGKQALFDFVGAQYFSPIRSQRVCVRGERGEIVDQTLFGYASEGEPLALPFRRVEAGPNGNLEGLHLKGIQLGENWVYRNPTVPARLPDEEVAMADMLLRMGSWARRDGPAPYALAEAMQDHYLGLLIRAACEGGEPQSAVRQAWA
jgi:predicted dehydrogenase